MRQYTHQVWVGPVPVGGGAPISVQSMTNTETRDTAATLGQIQALAQAGCEIVRVAVPDERAAEALKTLVLHSPVPLVADIHFDHRLALLSLEAGVHKLRLNPGNPDRSTGHHPGPDGTSRRRRSGRGFHSLHA